MGTAPIFLSFNAKAISLMGVSVLNEKFSLSEICSRADLNNKAAKWRWVTDSCYMVEESISKWIHTNLARISM